MVAHCGIYRDVVSHLFNITVGVPARTVITKYADILPNKSKRIMNILGFHVYVYVDADFVISFSLDSFLPHLLFLFTCDLVYLSLALFFLCCTLILTF